jgi:hypothetical protein
MVGRCNSQPDPPSHPLLQPTFVPVIAALSTHHPHTPRHSICAPRTCTTAGWGGWPVWTHHPQHPGPWRPPCSPTSCGVWCRTASPSTCTPRLCFTQTSTSRSPTTRPATCTCWRRCVCARVCGAEHTPLSPFVPRASSHAVLRDTANTRVPRRDRPRTQALTACARAAAALTPTQQTYYVSRQHRRAVMLLKQHGVLDDVRFRCVQPGRADV